MSIQQTTGVPPISRRTGGRGLAADGLAVLALWALILAFYWRIALAGRVLAAGDAYLYFYPYWAEATRSLQSGRLPLWNPYLFMGVPFLANSQAGVFYPLNWLLWFTLPPHISIHTSIVLHLCLAALNAYAWARGVLRLGCPWASVAAATFVLGGYLGAQVEHVNQVQGLAWLPLALLLAYRVFAAWPSGGTRRPVGAVVGLALVVALIFLTGHAQVAFITLVGVAISVAGQPVWRWLRGRPWQHRGPGPGTRTPGAVSGWVWQIGLLAVTLGLGTLLAAVQLLPTLELSRLSIRAGGLPFEERVSFSLSPLYLARALLPGFAAPVPPAHMEHVAYVGVAGLALMAVALWGRPSARANQSTQPALLPAVLLASLGLFLALGGYNPLYLLLARFVPGFAHFRVPARWLVFTALGMAGLAACGLRALWVGSGWRARPRLILWLAVGLLLLVGWAVEGPRLGEGASVRWPTVLGWLVAGALALGLLLLAGHRPRLAVAGLLIVLVAELWLAGLSLPYSRATAPQAFTGLRPAVAHLRATARPGDRFLSMSDITFDPGDLAEINVIYGPQLNSGALYDYIVSAKLREVLSPDLSLAFGVPAVDGYDGGVLPLARYVALQRLFLPADQLSLDGRLRENLQTLPAGRWLNLFRVRYIITDKLHDAWLDDVFYDLQFGARLRSGEEVTVAHVPSFEATALGMVSYLDGAAELATGTPVGIAEIAFSDGLTRAFELRAGEDTAEGRYDAGVLHTLATVGGHFWPGEPEGNDYVVRLRWSGPAAPVAVRVRATLPDGELVVRGLSLIDERTGGFQALVVSDQNRLRLAHSGDVKIYENGDVLARAFLVHRATVASDVDAALATMFADSFDPASEAVLERADAVELRPTSSAGAAETEPVTVLVDTPEQLEFEVEANTPGYLVLTDAWYPGWQATVDGQPVPLLRADVLFRAVYVEPGVHRVLFAFRPASLRWGSALSLAGLLGLVAMVLFVQRCPKARAML